MVIMCTKETPNFGRWVEEKTGTFQYIVHEDLSPAEVVPDHYKVSICPYCGYRLTFEWVQMNDIYGYWKEKQ